MLHLALLTVLALGQDTRATLARPDAAGGGAQVADTFQNEAVRQLVQRAQAARRETGEGIESYEAEIQDRLYVGLRGAVFRRERTMFEQARRANVLWSRDGVDLVQWTGGQQRIPIAGLDTSSDSTLLAEFSSDLLGGERPMAMLDPREDILSFGESDDPDLETGEEGNDQILLHPLADTAVAHYRYLQGDTLTLSFVGDESPVRLAEVRVEPRRVDPRLVAASLWFDLETGQLARASLRPSTPYRVAVDGPMVAEAVYGMVGPFELEVRYITIDYSLQERRWWMPRRFAFEGEARAGRWIGVPFLLETTLSGYSVNPVEPELTVERAEAQGFTVGELREREGDRGDESTISMIPHPDSLAAAGLIGEPDKLETGAIVFDEEEIDRIRADLERIVGQVQVARRPELGFGIRDGLWRFNRVEGLSIAARTSMPLTALSSISVEGRIGYGDWEPRGELRVERALDDYTAWWGAYRRLADGSDFDDPLDASSSIKNLFIGQDAGQFYDAFGTEIGVEWLGRSVGLDGAVFLEEHRAVEAETDFHLFKPITDDSARVNILADEGRVGGVRARLRWSRGPDPAGTAAWGVVRGEVGSGDFDYQRFSSSAGLGLPALGGFQTAFETGAGTSWGDRPVQRLHYLGGGSTVRGFRESSLAGEAFWYGRAEVATAFPAFRLSVFGDAGWAGPKDEFTLDDPWVGVGTGLSMMDGVVRLDFARGVRRGSSWHLYLYFDGIL